MVNNNRRTNWIKGDLFPLNFWSNSNAFHSVMARSFTKECERVEPESSQEESIFSAIIKADIRQICANIEPSASSSNTLFVRRNL